MVREFMLWRNHFLNCDHILGAKITKLCTVGNGGYKFDILAIFFSSKNMATIEKINSHFVKQNGTQNAEQKTLNSKVKLIVCLLGISPCVAQTILPSRLQCQLGSYFWLQFIIIILYCWLVRIFVMGSNLFELACRLACRSLAYSVQF